MKTKEFVEQMQSRGFKVVKESYATYVESSKSTLALIREGCSYVFDTCFTAMKELDPTTRRELVEIIIEYANTPIEERKEDKKYTLRFIHLEEYEYLTLCTARGENKIEFGEEQNNNFYQTQFTDDEINGLPNWVSVMLEQGHLVKEEVK